MDKGLIGYELHHFKYVLMFIYQVHKVSCNILGVGIHQTNSNTTQMPDILYRPSVAGAVLQAACMKEQARNLTLFQI